MKLRSALVGLFVAFVAFAAAAVMPTGAFALDVPPKPTDIPVVDQTNTLTNEQKASLAKQIASERETSGNQIAIVMVKSLGNDSIEDASLKIARGWGIGTGENNNGVLLLVAKDDRRLRIEVGTGLEGALTDVQSGRIIRDDITPFFRDGNYYGGIQNGLTKIIESIHGEYKASSTKNSSDAFKFPWEFIIFGLLIGFSWLGSILARTKSWWAGGVIGVAAGGIFGLVVASVVTGAITAAVLGLIGLIFDKVVSQNYRSHAHHGDSPSWWAGGGTLGGGGSGGGFGGFGGGDFGGGGSSGSW